MSVKRKFPIESGPARAGQRPALGVIASELGVSISQMADAAAISRTAMFGIVGSNTWPTRTPADEIRTALRELFEAHGASDEQMTVMFHAHTHRRSPAQRQGSATPPPATPDDPHPPTGFEATHAAITQEVTDMLLPKQTLGRAAGKAFQLFANPFDGEVIEDAQMYTSGEIAYVREACLQAAKGGRFVAVVGESGAGKTTIQSDLESRIARDKLPILVIKPWVTGMEDSDSKGKTLKSTDILASIVTTLDPLASMPQTLQARNNKARDLLTMSAESGFSHLLVIEEAHSMPEATLKHLKRLHEMRLGRKPLLGILLLGQTELGMKLDPRRANLREVVQRCEVVHLLPLDGDLQAYLAHRAQTIGRELGEFIDASGVEEIRARLTITRPGAGGKTRAASLLYPLAVNNLVTAALNTAAELGAPIVNRDVVRAV